MEPWKTRRPARAPRGGRLHQRARGFPHRHPPRRLRSSGERQGFFGVDLRGGGKDDAIVRAIQDPVQGPLLRVNVPGTDKALTLQPGPGCAHFEVQVERQNSRINNISNVRGRVRVACDTPELALDADITFANCH
jgi:hypothetical protein